MVMDNGHCADPARASKYKRRRVSAIRDFPPGCGFVATNINLRPGKEVTGAATFENLMSENNGDVTPSGGGAEFSSQVISQNHLQSMVPEQMMSSSQVDGLESMKAEPARVPLPELEPGGNCDVSNDSCKVDQFELKKTDFATMPLAELEFGKDAGIPLLELEHTEIFNVSKQSYQVDVVSSKQEIAPPYHLKFWSPPGQPIVSCGDDSKMTATRHYPPRRKVSAIRDFPPYFGRNAPCLSGEECLEVIDSANNKILGLEKSGDEDITTKTFVNQMRHDIEGGDVCKSRVEGDVGRIIKDNVQPGYEGVAAKKREQDEFGAPSGKEMLVAQEDAREYCEKYPCGTNELVFEDKIETVTKTDSNDVEHLDENLGKEIVVYMEGKIPGRNISDLSDCESQLQDEGPGNLEFPSGRVLVQGLMASVNCPWRQGKKNNKANITSGKSERKVRKNEFILLPRTRPVQFTNDSEGEDSQRKCAKQMNPSSNTNDYQGVVQLITWKGEDDKESESCYMESRNLDVILPPSHPSSSCVNSDDSDVIGTRNKVRETLRLFQAVCRKLLQEEEAKPQARPNTCRRIDYMAARILKDKGKYVNTGKQILGSVPGVEVGDVFHYRVELTIIGLHRQTQSGIDYVKEGGKILATSIVASRGYDDELDNSDVLIYTGQGGNVMNGDKEPEDQKLERGNLALANSKQTKNPVRVIRGEMKASDSSDIRARTYIYDGLYLVEDLWQEQGPHGKLVFKFRLLRIPGQPELAWKEVKKSKKSKEREGLCVHDISEGKELIPICAVNTIDDEKPPPFEYITGMMYPDWCQPLPPKGCNCTTGCSESGNCSCVIKNGGEIPYNHNGAIVEAKPLVYECGPSCKCPPSCYNRVSQHGIKLQLEVFKTETRGWGVRSLNSIPSGSFICEYAGELLEEKEADERTGNDEYLFDIGNNYSDSSLWDELSNLMPESTSNSSQVVEDGGFTIDAAKYGNVGRFINHSCSPNLYAQNVLYDHDDKRIPHIMLFAAENIPPLQELSYHYNYMIDQGPYNSLAGPAFTAFVNRHCGVLRRQSIPHSCFL